MAIHSRLGFLDPPSHIWQRSQKFQMHIIESGEVVKPLATLATLTNLPWNDAHNWKWRGCQNSDNFGTSDKLATRWCILFHLLIFLLPLILFALPRELVDGWRRKSKRANGEKGACPKCQCTHSLGWKLAVVLGRKNVIFSRRKKELYVHGGRGSDDSHIFPRFGTFQMWIAKNKGSLSETRHGLTFKKRKCHVESR